MRIQYFIIARSQKSIESNIFRNLKLLNNYIQDNYYSRTLFPNLRICSRIIFNKYNVLET